MDDCPVFSKSQEMIHETREKENNFRVFRVFRGSREAGNTHNRRFTGRTGLIGYGFPVWMKIGFTVTVVPGAR